MSKIDEDYDIPPLEITETMKMLTEKRYAELVAAEKERHELRKQLAAAREIIERLLEAMSVREQADSMEVNRDYAWDIWQNALKYAKEFGGSDAKAE